MMAELIMKKKQLVFLIFLSSFAFCESTDATEGLEKKNDKKGISEEVIIEKDEEPVDSQEKDLHVKMKPLGGAILLQGDVRMRYKVFQIKDGSQNLVGGTTGLANDRFISEFNLYVSYRMRNFYARTQFGFTNNMGSMGGGVLNLNMKRAYIGANMIKYGPTIIGVELGRRGFSEMLESKVQYDSTMNGASVFFTSEVPKFFEINMRIIANIVDFTTSHYAYFGDISFYNISEFGFYVKYTYSDWRKKGETRIFNGSREPVVFGGVSKEINNPRYQFQISQFTMGYMTREKILGALWRLYGACLVNHAAKKRSLTQLRKENFAAYMGATYGNAVKTGEFSFDLNFQYVEAQSLPDFDAAGIGTGNPRSNVFYGPAKNDITGAELAPEQITALNANGQTNFKGVSLSFGYILTKNTFWQINAQYSKRLDSQIGPQRIFKQIDTSLIYSF
jgi:hypothetical protein